MLFLKKSKKSLKLLLILNGRFFKYIFFNAIAPDLTAILDLNPIAQKKKKGIRILPKFSDPRLTNFTSL